MKEIGGFDFVGIIETLRMRTMFPMYLAIASLRIHNIATTTAPYQVPLHKPCVGAKLRKKERKNTGLIDMTMVR